MDAFKFYAKLFVIKLRALMFLVAPVDPNRNGWENRVLIINLDLIGDIVMFTGVLKHYRAAMPYKKIFILLNASGGVDPVLVRDHVDEVIRIDTEAFKSKPGYGYSFVKKMRHVGFAKVIEHNPGAEFVGKVVATELGAQELIGYHGFAIDDTTPTSENFAKGLQYFRNVLAKKFTKIIPTIPEIGLPKRFTHMVSHYAAIFEGVVGKKTEDPAPALPDPFPSDEVVKKLVGADRVMPLSYCLLSLGTSTPRKEWPVARFAELGKLIRERDIPIVLTGGKKDIPKSKMFIEALGTGKGIIDLTGKTSLSEAASLVKFSLFAMSNDTSIAHFAIAFKRPSLTVMWLANPGRTTLYGYPDINKWVFKADFPCYGDNGRCANNINPGDPSPCVAAITVEDAKKVLVPLLDYLKSGAAYPVEKFTLTL